MIKLKPYNNKAKSGSRIVNRQARYNYDLFETYKVGIALHGWEVKSIRKGSAKIVDAYLSFSKGELWIKNLSINPLPSAYDRDNIVLGRDIKILMKRREIITLKNKISQKRITLVPVEVFVSKNLIKARIAVAKGKNKYDKRCAIKLKDQKRLSRREASQL